MRIVVLQHRSRELLYLAESYGFPTHVMPRDGGGLDPTANR